MNLCPKILRRMGSISEDVWISGAETVWFSFVTYKNKTHRNQVNKKVMAHFKKAYAGKQNEPMPFDFMRMAYGGFSVEVD